MTEWVWLVLLLAVMLPGAAFFIGKILFRLYARPPRLRPEGTPADYGLRFRDVRFTADDEVGLRGWLILPFDYTRGEKYPAVITLHGYFANRTQLHERNAIFSRDGFVVLTFDWRRNGESEGEECSGGLNESQDLRAALEFLRSQPEVDTERIALYGFSMGASVALLVAAEDEKIRAVVADSPYATMWDIARRIMRHHLLPPFPFLQLMDREFKKSFGAGLRDVDVVKAAAQYSPRPLLLLAGERDRLVPFEHSIKIFEAVGNNAIFQINPNGGHFGNAEPETFEEVILPFLRDHLGR